jgi:hypothetical protein
MSYTSVVCFNIYGRRIHGNRVSSATEIVLDEEYQASRRSPRPGQIPLKQLISMISHYACTILLHRLATFVEEEQQRWGSYKEKETRVFLKRIDQISVQGTHTCKRQYRPPTWGRMIRTNSSTLQRGRERHAISRGVVVKWYSGTGRRFERVRDIQSTCNRASRERHRTKGER